jgi:hypothetical protein
LEFADSIAASVQDTIPKGHRDAPAALAKMELLGYLLEHFDEGRSKTFYCTGCQLLPLDSLKAALTEAEMTINESADIKEKSQLVRAAISRLADALSVDLKLRR